MSQKLSPSRWVVPMTEDGEAIKFASEAQLEELKAELAAIKSAQTDGSQKVQQVGNIPEYQWLSTDTPPELGATDRAFGVEMNTTTHEMTIYYWTGSAWQVKS